jgi:hypothetical protein
MLFIYEVLPGEQSMIDFVSTIAAALIGSVIGSVGAVLTDHWLTGRSEKFHRREVLVQRYLFQLQDALEMLWYRLKNLAFRGGQNVMSKKYYETTTLYALGRVLAIERIFVLEAVYPQLDAIYPGLGKSLKEQRIERQLPTYHFFQFDRISLAETIIVHEEDLFRTCTFLEFRRQYEAENAAEKEWLAPAWEAIQSLSAEGMKALLATLEAKAKIISEKAGIGSSLTEHN